MFGWNWALMLPVDSGKIQLETINNNRLSFEYEISLRRILLIAGVICMIIYSKSNSVTIGLISFAWLGGMNWLIAVFRHHFFFRRIITQIQYWE